jgi:hypothetical protein
MSFLVTNENPHWFHALLTTVAQVTPMCLEALQRSTMLLRSSKHGYRRAGYVIFRIQYMVWFTRRRECLIYKRWKKCKRIYTLYTVQYVASKGCVYIYTYIRLYKDIALHICIYVCLYILYIYIHTYIHIDIHIDHTDTYRYIQIHIG